MPDLNADSALVGPAQPPMLRPDPPGVWDVPEDAIPPAPPPAPTPQPTSTPADDLGDSLEPREFDDRVRQPFHGLLWLGHLNKDIVLYGHRFSLSTPSGTERLQIGQVISDWSGTLTEEIAFARATVAAFLTKVDGIPLPEPVLNHPKDTALHDRFVWVGENLISQTVINQLFQECMLLDREVELVLEAMGKAPRQPE